MCTVKPWKPVIYPEVPFFPRRSKSNLGKGKPAAILGRRQRGPRRSALRKKDPQLLFRLCSLSHCSLSARDLSFHFENHGFPIVFQASQDPALSFPCSRLDTERKDALPVTCPSLKGLHLPTQGLGHVAVEARPYSNNHNNHGSSGLCHRLLSALHKLRKAQKCKA